MTAVMVVFTGSLLLASAALAAIRVRAAGMAALQPAPEALK